MCLVINISSKEKQTSEALESEGERKLAHFTIVPEGAKQSMMMTMLMMTNPTKTEKTATFEKMLVL
jgi:hypothetical protein